MQHSRQTRTSARLRLLSATASASAPASPTSTESPPVASLASRRLTRRTITTTTSVATDQHDSSLSSELSDSDADSDACDSCGNHDESESDSEVDVTEHIQPKRQPPPSKRKRKLPAPTDSDSEPDADPSSASESDAEFTASSKPTPTKRAKKSPASRPVSSLQDKLTAVAPAAKKKRAAPKAKHPSDDTMTIARLANASKLVGAHISVAGGLENATVNAMKIGCNAMSFFLTSPRTWKSKPLADATVAAFMRNCEAHGYAPGECMIPHGSYLVNLGNPDPELREKSYDFFLDELKRCDALGIKYYNFHPGSSVGKCTPSASIQHIATCINRALAATTSVHAVIENTAGQGQVVGHSWEQLRELIDLVDDKQRVGVCLDTCHMFAAGYDLRTREAFDKSFREFDEVVGYAYLRAFHVNDSKFGLGSKKDRHAPLGKGEIGLEPFKWLMEKPEFDGKLFILETPEETNWADEIKLLHSYMLDAETKIAANGQE